VEADLLASIDAGLRSRAQVLAQAIDGTQERNVVLGEGKLIDPDEAFAQVLDASGRIIESGSAVSNAPLLSADEIRSMSGLFFISRQMENIRQYDSLDDPFRLLAVSVGQSPQRIVVVGATLSDVNEALQGLLTVMLTIGPVAILLMAGAGWLL